MYDDASDAKKWITPLHSSSSSWAASGLNKGVTVHTRATASLP